MIAVLATLGAARAEPSCEAALVQAARDLPVPAPSTPRLAALPGDAPDQRTGCGQTCRPSGGWLVIPIVPSSVVDTSHLDGPSYRAARAIDGDPRTPWVEGARGRGRGEGLVFEFDEPVAIDRVEIVPGHARSQQLFLANNRVSAAWMSFLPWPAGTVVPAPAPPRFEILAGAPVPCAPQTSAADTVVLSGDPEAPEALRWDLSPHWCRRPTEGRVRHVVLRIGEVVAGHRFDDTAIGEVRFARLEPILGSRGWICD